MLGHKNTERHFSSGGNIEEISHESNLSASVAADSAMAATSRMRVAIIVFLHIVFIFLDFRLMIEPSNFVQPPPTPLFLAPLRCDIATARKMRGGSATICATGVSPMLKIGISGIRGA